MTQLKIEYRRTDELIPYAKNARTHSDVQVAQIAESIKEFGFTNPVLIDHHGGIIAGHGRVMAAKALGVDSVPTIMLGHLSERQKQAYILADNKIALNSGWDFQMLAEELSELAETDYDLDLIGFNEQELDALLKDDASILPHNFDQPEVVQVPEHTRSLPSKAGRTEDEATPRIQSQPVSQRGDVWVLGEHRLMCGDSTSSNDVTVLMVGRKADMVFTDPLYNVKISGLGQHGRENSIGALHGEFVMASGEMSEDEFTNFLRKVFRNISAASKDGAISYVCMDWRHMREILNASDGVDSGELEVEAARGVEQGPGRDGNVLPEQA